MLNEQVFSNARVVTAEQVFTGTVVVRDGLIAEVEWMQPVEPGRDMQGDYLLPGLVELHTDNWKSTCRRVRVSTGRRCRR